MKGIKCLVFFIFFVNLTMAQQAYYYYQGEKIFLKENKEKILLKLSKNADRKRLQTLISGDLTVQIISKDKTKEIIGPFLVLQNKSKGFIPSFTVSKFRNSPDVASAVPVMEYEGKEQGITNEFIIKLKAGTTYQQLEVLSENNLCFISSENKFVKDQFIITVSKKSPLSALELANKFYETGLFDFSEPNFVRFKAFHSNDPLFINQWPLKNTGQGGGTIGADINIEAAWEITEGQPEIKIAVVDEGVDLTHPDLTANLLSGFDATGNGSGGAPTGNDAHGTACAGIIAAIKDNGIGVAGVAPNCKIIPIRAGIEGSLSDSWIADGLNFAWQNGADVISNSYGGGSPATAVTNAVNNAVLQGRDGLGCVLLFSSGNDSENGKVNVSYPANLQNVIAVGATTNQDEKTDYSNYGIDLDVSAPGGNKSIYSTDISGPAGYNTSGNDYTSTFDGTSAACPHAAGVAALVLSVNRCLKWDEVKSILELSCDKKGEGGSCFFPKVNGTWNEKTGYGRINAYNAVRYAVTKDFHTFSVGGNITHIGDNIQMGVLGNCYVAAANYVANIRRIDATINYPYTPNPVLIGSANGWSGARPNSGETWFSVISLTPTEAQLRTFTYEFTALNGSYVGWKPASPSDIRFNVTVLSKIDAVNIYKQNQTVTGTEQHYAANSIIAGNNVTSSVGQGNYVIASGANVKFYAGKRIVLEPGFIVEEGATFEAGIVPLFTCTQFPNGRMAHSPNSISYFNDYDTEFTPNAEENLNFEEKLKPIIYPIPFNDKLTIEYSLPESQNVIVSIALIDGQELIKLTNNAKHEQGKYRIDFDGINLSAGTYLIKIQSDNQTYTQKVLKIK